METFHIEIVGKVQGVGFRYFARERARELGIAGWVKNKSDGNVEIAAAGEAVALGKFHNAVGEGPSGAQISEVRELPPVDETDLEKPFAIVR